MPIDVFLKVNLKKSEKLSCKPSHKLDGCWSEKNQNVSISSDSIYDSFAYDPVKTRLSEFEVEAEEPTNNKAWNQIFISHKQSRCSASDSIGLIFTRSNCSMLLIMTQIMTPSQVKTSLMCLFFSKQKQQAKCLHNTCICPDIKGKVLCYLPVTNTVKIMYHFV